MSIGKTGYVRVNIDISSIEGQSIISVKKGTYEILENNEKPILVTKTNKTTGEKNSCFAIKKIVNSDILLVLPAEISTDGVKSDVYAITSNDSAMIVPSVYPA